MASDKVEPKKTNGRKWSPAQHKKFRRTLRRTLKAKALSLPAITHPIAKMKASKIKPLRTTNFAPDDLVNLMKDELYAQLYAREITEFNRDQLTILFAATKK